MAGLLAFGSFVLGTATTVAARNDAAAQQAQYQRQQEGAQQRAIINSQNQAKANSWFVDKTNDDRMTLSLLEGKQIIANTTTTADAANKNAATFFTESATAAGEYAANLVDNTSLTAAARLDEANTTRAENVNAASGYAKDLLESTTDIAGKRGAAAATESDIMSANATDYSNSLISEATRAGQERVKNIATQNQGIMDVATATAGQERDIAAKTAANYLEQGSIVQTQAQQDIEDVRTAQAKTKGTQTAMAAFSGVKLDTGDPNSTIGNLLANTDTLANRDVSRVQQSADSQTNLLTGQAGIALATGEKSATNILGTAKNTTTTNAANAQEFADTAFYNAGIAGQQEVKKAKLEGQTLVDNTGLQGAADIANAKLVGNKEVSQATTAGDTLVRQSAIQGKTDVASANLIGKKAVDDTTIQGNGLVANTKLQGETAVTNATTQASHTNAQTILTNRADSFNSMLQNLAFTPAEGGEWLGRFEQVKDEYKKTAPGYVTKITDDYSVQNTSWSDILNGKGGPEFQYGNDPSLHIYNTVVSPVPKKYLPKPESKPPEKNELDDYLKQYNNGLENQDQPVFAGPSMGGNKK